MVWLKIVYLFWSPQSWLEMSPGLVKKHPVLLPQKQVEMICVPVKYIASYGYKLADQKSAKYFKFLHKYCTLLNVT